MSGDDESATAIAAMRAVTVSREYGSGGGEVAARLANRLGWQLIDHEIVVRVANELRETPDEAEIYDERAEGFVGRLLSSLEYVQMAQHAVGPKLLAHDAAVYFQALRRVVTGAVAEGHVIIVGRGGQFLLRERRDVLHARIVAPLAARVRYVQQRENLDEAAAQRRIEAKDRDRIRFLQTVAHQYPADPLLYDLVINTGILSLDAAAELIAGALAAKASRRDLPADQLGPGAGLTTYPGRPHDLVPPADLDQAADEDGENGENGE